MATARQNEKEKRGSHAHPAPFGLALFDARRLCARHADRRPQDARGAAAAVTLRRPLAAALAAMLLAQCAPVQAERVVNLPAAAVDPAVGARRAPRPGERQSGKEGVSA